MLPGFEPRILNGNCCLSNQSDRSNSFPEGDGVLGMRGILEDVTFEICALVQSCRFTADPAHFFTGNTGPSANQIMNQSLGLWRDIHISMSGSLLPATARLVMLFLRVLTPSAHLSPTSSAPSLYSLS
jgi:hypothetical protein